MCDYHFSALLLDFEQYGKEFYSVVLLIVFVVGPKIRFSFKREKGNYYLAGETIWFLKSILKLLNY